jgi:hypothetical protein
MTVKLDTALEQRLRRQSAALGRSASELIREALAAYLDQSPSLPSSAYALGCDLFGHFGGPPNMAARRKSAVVEVWGRRRANPG